MNQDQFLGHENYNGKTRSMSELQKEQQAVWSNAVTSAIGHGHEAYTAIQLADAALAAFNTRFVPPIFNTQ